MAGAVVGVCLECGPCWRGLKRVTKVKERKKDEVEVNIGQNKGVDEDRG